jgi:hypothetical protein
MLVVVIVSGFIFSWAARERLMVPVQNWVYADKTYKDSHGEKLPHEYLPFQPWLYSLDTFVPFVDLGQKSSWELHPRTNGQLKYWSLETWYLFHVMAGWGLAGALVAGLSGLVKKE